MHAPRGQGAKNDIGQKEQQTTFGSKKPINQTIVVNVANKHHDSRTEKRAKIIGNVKLRLFVCGKEKGHAKNDTPAYNVHEKTQALERRMLHFTIHGLISFYHYLQIYNYFGLIN